MVRTTSQYPSQVTGGFSSPGASHGLLCLRLVCLNEHMVFGLAFGEFGNHQD